MELRHPRFIRRPEGNLALQERDMRIFELLYEHRFLDTKTIGLHLRHEGSDWALQSRLRKLFDHCYVDRPPQQLALQVSGEERFMIHALGRRGAQALSDHCGSLCEPRRWTQKNSEATNVFLLHAIGIARFRTSLNLAIPDDAPREGTPDYSRPYLLPWLEGERIRAKVKLKNRSEREIDWTLTPDGFFGVQKPKLPPNHSYYFVEFQRTTPSSPERFVLAKGKAYSGYLKSGKQAEDHGIKGFRVLVIAQTERKMNTLRRYIRNWLNTDPGAPPGLWLFTTEERYDLEHPETILTPIWKTVNEKRLVSLLE